ncbi:MAG TPA: efflux RND transporter permease subunit, partial [Gemmataceae bacterium]
MLNWIINFSLHHRPLILLGALALAVGGSVSLRYLDNDAFPDTTPVQVQINTIAPALNPEEVEQRITLPIEQKIGGLPRLQQMRSVSKFGLSQVVVTFDDGTDIYFARQLINERLGAVELPVGTERPQMGPVATGLGEVFHYVVTIGGNDLTELRTIHDWNVKPKLRAVRGTAEINSWGGNEKQYQIRIDPDRLIRHGVSFDEVVQAVREKSNFNVGGGTIRRGSQMLLVQGVGRAADIDDLKAIDITSKNGVPVRVGEVADVEIGSEIRRGAVTADGKGEVVLGLGFMLMGGNSHEVTWSLKNRLDEIKPTLPRNVKIETVYDRTELVAHVIDTVRENLFEGGLLVVAVLFLFLGNLRAACIVALAIPLSMLFAFAGMLRFGIAASLLSLGAIDFGMVVDSSVVMVENCVRHIARGDFRGRSYVDVVREAAIEVRKPTLFGELIIMTVYLPILTLEGIEGKLFRPMALTVIFALAGSMILSLTLMPVLASLVLPKYDLFRGFFRWLYGPFLRWLAPRGRSSAIVFQACVLVLYGAALGFIGSMVMLNGRARFGRAQTSEVLETSEVFEGKLLTWPALLVAGTALTVALAAYSFLRELTALLFPEAEHAEEREPLVMRLAKWLYRPVLRFSMNHPLTMLLFAVLVL